ncbi:MAG: sigma-54-dependent Fis family transcriptional regulator [Myxococcales bacterium]|nr:sigma-54-dependent Fis family transcriptional regulator [Myxococcales bacterium]
MSARPVGTPARFGAVLGCGDAMHAVFERLRRIAPSELSALIIGETGTGKELVARAIHANSPRRDRPFVVLDCSAIPRDLIESTLFGHERGAFTGAIAQHRGVFEQAEGGTIFLDEVGELDPAMQPKLLRVLENHELKRVGGDRTLRADVRVVAATNRDLSQMVAEGRFREDLFFRLGVVQVRLPALRERSEDIPHLVADFLLDFNLARASHGQPPLRVSAEAMHALRERPWPGNVRELKNVVTRAASLGEGPLLTSADFMLGPQLEARGPADDPEALQVRVDLALSFKDAKQAVLDAFEQRYLDRLLAAHEGNISRSARAAGLTRYHLRELLKKHGLRAR